MIVQHMKFTAAALIATGDLLAHVGDWTGLPPSDLLELLRGSASVSSGGSEEMETMKKAFSNDSQAREALESNEEPAKVLNTLRSLKSAAGIAVAEYLDLVGNRLIDGFDIAEPSVWAIQDGTLYLLQCRAVTTGKTPPKGVPLPPPPRDPVATIQKVDLFANLDRRQAQQIIRLFKPHTFIKGQTVILEGSGGGAFYLIESGEAIVSTKGINLATLGAGDFFGEIALIDGGSRSASVTAATDMLCYGLTYWEFRPLIEKNGALGWKLLEAMAKRLRAANSRQ